MNVSRIVSRRFPVSFAIAIAGVVVSGAFLSGCTTGEDLDPDAAPHTALKQSMDRAQEVALKSNISQIDQFIGMYRGDNDGKAPADMDELKRASKFPAEMFVNPVDNKPLLYDGQTGKITVQPYDRGMDAGNLPKLPDGSAAGATSP